MKTMLEHNGVELIVGGGKVMRKGYAMPLHAPALIHICAWCDPDKTLAQSLEKAGYKLSHGVCERHK